MLPESLVQASAGKAQLPAGSGSMQPHWDTEISLPGGAGLSLLSCALGRAALWLAPNSSSSCSKPCGENVGLRQEQREEKLRMGQQKNAEYIPLRECALASC